MCLQRQNQTLKSSFVFDLRVNLSEYRGTGATAFFSFSNQLEMIETIDTEIIILRFQVTNANTYFALMHDIKIDKRIIIRST